MLYCAWCGNKILDEDDVAFCDYSDKICCSQDCADEQDAEDFLEDDEEWD